MSVLRRGCWGQLQRVKRGGGSAQLEPHQTLPATLSSQNSSSLWLQSRFSSLQPGPAQRRPLGVWTSPSPPPRFTPGGNIREKQTQPLLLYNKVVTKEQLDKSSGGMALSSDPRQKETPKSCLQFQGHPSPDRRYHNLWQSLCFFKSSYFLVWGSRVGF